MSFRATEPCFFACNSISKLYPSDKSAGAFLSYNTELAILVVVIPPERHAGVSAQRRIIEINGRPIGVTARRTGRKVGCLSRAQL